MKIQKKNAVLEKAIHLADGDSFRVYLRWRWDKTGIRLDSVLTLISLGQAIFPFSIRTFQLYPLSIQRSQQTLGAMKLPQDSICH